jgi:hypothetical protein
MTDNKSHQYLVHHNGQIQGPFSVDFISAMVMAGVYPLSVVVQKHGTSKQIPFATVAPVATRIPVSEIPTNPDSRRQTLDLPYSAPPKKQPTKLTKTESKVAWGFGIFIVIIIIFAANDISSLSISPKTSPPVNGNLTQSNPDKASATTQAEKRESALFETSYTPSASTSNYKPALLKIPDSTNLPTPSFSKASSPKIPDDTKIYRDGSGRTYRVSNSDYSRLLTKQSALGVKQANLNAEEARLKALASDVDQTRRRLDRTSQYSVDAFNSKVSRVNTMNSQVQFMVDDYNRDVEAFNADLESVGTPIN